MTLRRPKVNSLIRNTAPMISLRKRAIHPWGLQDLDPQVRTRNHQGIEVRCYVKGCQEWLRPPNRTFLGDACPVHHIRCHVTGKKGTYSYRDHRRNLIVAQEVFQEQIIGHPFKYETHRFGYERSEDALSWNVFRSLYEQKKLAHAVAALTGEEHPEEPQMYLWGIAMSDFHAWTLLEEARKIIESNLPVERPLTEPDIALHLPGKYLILIEAKFTSANTFYEKGPRKDARSLTQDELLAIYQFQESRSVNMKAAVGARRIPQQLWRNMVFAEKMAMQDSGSTKAYHINLVREEAEMGIEEEFRALLTQEYQPRFRRVTWEGLVHSTCNSSNQLDLRYYFHNKTAGLAAAFRHTSIE